MRYHFWYVLIHVGLGLIGWQYFTFTNTGGIYAFCAALLVQAYAAYEIHREAWPRFSAMRDEEPSLQARNNMYTEYKKRLARTWFMRSCLYALLTLLAAMAVRGEG